MIQPSHPKLKPALAALVFLSSLLAAAAQTSSAPSPGDSSTPAGVKISYQLPTDGPLPKTYRVTIAAVDAKDPNWVISTFAAGVVRTVTADNQGKFSETWNGLDDNYMPVPPGTYALKGIYMPADKWAIDGEYHTITPKLTSCGCSWGQSPAEDTQPDKIEGDPVGSPFRDIDVTPSGMGALYFQYLENGRNAFFIDLTKPIDYSQIGGGFPSGGIAGGTSVCTDGTDIWMLGGGPPFIMLAGGKPFGHGRARFNDNVYLCEGHVTGMAAWPDPQAGKTVVFVAERGKVAPSPPPHQWRMEESTTDMVNKVVALDGKDATELVSWSVDHPLSVKARHGKLYVLRGADGKYEVDSLPLDANWKTAQFTPCLTVPAGITPFDLEVDSHGRFYLSDSAANHVYQFDAQGNKVRTYGKLDVQKGGAYDPQSFMSPEKLSSWTDAQGKDRLLIVEQGGPNRLSEWSGDDGTMINQWVTPQLEANDGYAVDPRHPDQIYMQGQLDTLVRWTIDYKTGAWTPNAVWFDVGTSHGGRGGFGDKLLQGLSNPRVIYHGDDLYLAFREGYVVYHLEGEKFRACAGILYQKTNPKDPKSRHFYLWRDLNGDGQVQDDEYLPFETTPPQGTLRYFGETWFDDMSLVAMGSGTADIWRLGPPTFDAKGTPIFDPKGWTKVLTDDVFVAKAAGTATATRGGNEAPSKGYDSSWADVAPGNNGDIYVNARFGPGFSSNDGAQFKLSRYVPDGKGGYKQLWRVGRMALQTTAVQGQAYGPIFPNPPVNGLVCIIDSARSGAEIYTEDGLYVDTLFPDGRLMSHDAMGVYMQGGEYFSGYSYVNKDNGKIYLALGKIMPLIFETVGWTTTQNPVKPLETLDKTVTLAANQIATPPEIALQVRGGAAAAKVARFYPATGGGLPLDGSMTGWEASDPVTFSSGTNQTVEARCFYDPDHLYIRWHARIGHKFTPQPLAPAQHLFAHDRGNDALGLYLQCDPNAPPGAKTPSGRPGDVRLVFGVFQDGGAVKPAILGMYPAWSGGGGVPITYATAQTTTFANVALVPGVQAGYKIDDDGQGYVLAASIPRAALPGAPDFNGWHTEGNFDANLGGHSRFWWSNSDGSASTETYDEPTEARLYPGSWSPVQFLPINTLPIHSWMTVGPFGFPGVVGLDVHKDRAQIIKTLTTSAFPPDTTRDLAAVYDGDITRTRVKQRKVQWKNAEISTDLVDINKALDWPGRDDEGTFYLLTHIYTPQTAQVTLNMEVPHGQCLITGQLNGKALPVVRRRDQTSLDASQPLTLQPGWNELLIRSDHIWGGMDLGANLVADPAILWKLKISGPTPVQPTLQ